MKREIPAPDIGRFPGFLRPFLAGARVFDCSSSPSARVLFLDREAGYFLKRAKEGTLAREAELTRYFHGLGLAAEVVGYGCSEGEDWLLTRRMPGEDCTAPDYLSDPARLADALGERLAVLHGIPPRACPVPDRTSEYLEAAERGFRRGQFEPIGEDVKFSSPEEAFGLVERRGGLLQSDTLIHGDYCLPNVILESWEFRGFVDVGFGGVGDRHVDLFWGAWSLARNLGTDRFRERFFDAYGRSEIDGERLRVVAAAECFGE